LIFVGRTGRDVSGAGFSASGSRFRFFRSRLIKALLASAATARVGTLSNRVFESYDQIVDLCCDAWNRLRDQPWRIMSIGMRH
jgi:hypothetical protein